MPSIEIGCIRENMQRKKDTAKQSAAYSADANFYTILHTLEANPQRASKQKAQRNQFLIEHCARVNEKHKTNRPNAFGGALALEVNKLA